MRDRLLSSFVLCPVPNPPSNPNPNPFPSPRKLRLFGHTKDAILDWSFLSEQEDKERAAEFNLHFTASYKYLSGSRWFGE